MAESFNDKVDEYYKKGINSKQIEPIEKVISCIKSIADGNRETKESSPENIKNKELEL